MDDPNNRGWFHPERLQAHAESEARRAEQRRPALSPPAEGEVRMTDEEWEDRCTCCDNTGITIQTERRCACQPPLAPTPAPIDWERVGPKLMEAVAECLTALDVSRSGGKYPDFEAWETNARAALAAAQPEGK